MKNIIFFSLSILLAIAHSTVSAQKRAENPFIRHIYTADPSVHVWKDNRLYVYPSHDIEPPKGCDKMDKYHVFSTNDMVNWKDHGQILEAKQVSWGRPEGGFMWAPDCAYKNKKYYFYFPHPSGTDWNQTWKIGVAVSKKPAKGFKEVGYIKGLGGFAMIDPSVFIDDDQQAYIYYGGGRKCQGGKLKENMIELDGEMKDMVGLNDFHEAAWVFKRKGIYYMVHSDRTKNQNKLLYAISNDPLGPWEHKGILLEGVGSDTSHGSVVEYKGKWYLFYHNDAISGRGNLRTICFDEVTFNEDGTMNTVIQTGMKGIMK
jgi:arabinoxylan arabinofuranohydrolase